MADPSVTLFGPVDALLAPHIEYVLLAVVVLNLVSRRVAHGAHKRQAENGDELSRHWFHTVTSWGLVLLSFYYLTLEHHSGMVLSILVLGTFVADFFEFEARKVEVRDDKPLEAPKGALVAATLTLLYAGYLSVFFFIEPYWSQVV